MNVNRQTNIDSNTRKIANDIVDSVQVDDIEDFESAKLILTAITNSESFAKLSPQLKGRVQVICEHLHYPGALISNQANHEGFKIAVQQRTAERIKSFQNSLQTILNSSTKIWINFLFTILKKPMNL